MSGQANIEAGERGALVLRQDRGGGIVELTLNRPDAYTALSSDLMRELAGQLTALAADPSARVIILQGSGPGFSAGHDLREVRALGDSDLNGIQIVWMLVGGEPDDFVRISSAEEFDLVELEQLRRRWINGHAVHDRVRNSAMVKKADKVIDLLEGHATGRKTHRFPATRNLFKERPVSGRTATDLDELDAQFNDYVNR